MCVQLNISQILIHDTPGFSNAKYNIALSRPTTVFHQPLLSTLSSITLNQLLFTLGVFHTVLLMRVFVTATPSIGMQRNICCWWTEAWFGQLDKLGVFCSKRFQHSSVLQLKEKLIQRERAVRMCCLKSLESDIKCLELSTECQWWFIYSQRCEFRRTMTMD